MDANGGAASGLLHRFRCERDVQALIEDPRLDQTALCRSMAFVDTMEHSGIATSGTTALQTPDDEFSG
ncbi:hypothetical protein NKI36_03480 [Mesorhizobium caraganae]|uniref:Uncharacterized protein n=1 Tax=Mesorhizobium caraganae TaxID=483206 RepID=A0ABV1YTX7_9HYPH